MRALRLGSLLALASFLAGTVPAAAWAYQVNRTQSGAEVHWNPLDIPVPYRLQADGTADVSDGSDLAAVEAGFHTWESQTCTSLAFTRQADYPGAPTISCNDGVNLVMWLESGWPPDVGPEAIGVTTPCFDPSTGEIGDADIWFNGVDYQWATDGRLDRVDVQNIATHEIGHFFGLGHSQYSDATMYYASAGNGETVRSTLSSDDVAAVCYLYPVNCNGNGDCTPPEVCINRRCQPAPPPPAGLGEACTEDQACQQGTGDNNAFCIQAAQGFPGGYCSIWGCSPTDAQGSCPTGGRCEDFGTDSQGNPVHLCMDACNPENPDCRDPDYLCLRRSATDPTDGICYPRCSSDADCGQQSVCDSISGLCTAPGNPNAKVGDACAQDSDCETGGWCIPETSQGKSTGFTGGYCTRTCGGGLGCSPGSSCYTIDENGNALCFEDCTPGDPGACRPGYACWPTGQPGLGLCFLACRSDAECGQDLVCNQNTGLCEMPAPPPPADGGMGNDGGSADGGVAPDGGGTADGGTGSDGGSAGPDGGTGGFDGGSVSADGGGSAGAGGGSGQLVGGCGCSAASGATPGLGALLVLLGGALRRRRRSSR
ncbi:MAG: hypothetical protein D6729_10645 [Deltaproteobacteria bacterium]|nr:MAG: hypothetical protein D6729_10645 [Deltaproteobacteria bacterium]